MESSRLIRSTHHGSIPQSSMVAVAAGAVVGAVGAGPGSLAPLPLDPAVRTGTLPNGLTYFIRRNQRPENRVLLRLAVQAGSIDEAEDQRGLAHVLEHMAFNGTTHFKPGELVKYLEVDRRAVRPARQRLHELRRDRLHARRADRPRRRARPRLRGAERLCRRHHARPSARSTGSAASSSRSGAAAWAPARACSSRRSNALYRRFAVRGPAADRHARGPEDASRRSGCATSTATTTAPTAWR